ncbi:MAG: pilus assembly protein N-terminal domain-containing protein [Clostridia bacterium]|nr:pilus assembly protein N-terminal domain-containing protein [Clostridia bacterium]
MKKILSLLLVLTMLLSFGTLAFAEEAPKLEALDNAIIGGSTRIYAGQTDEIHIYPKPDEAKEQFDIFKADITCSNPKVLDVQPGKRDSYAYGYVILTGKKTGTATVTVTEPESGVSCSFKVVVMPRFLSVLENALAFLMSLPGRILGTIYGHI